MDFLPWSTFSRYVARYDGNKGVRSLTCAEQFRPMAFDQLTCWGSLRDIEACLAAQREKLCHMGFRGCGFVAQPWPMPMSRATGALTPILRND